MKHMFRLLALLVIGLLPAVSAGHYRIFADIVHRSGFPETMVGAIDLPDLTGKALAQSVEAR